MKRFLIPFILLFSIVLILLINSLQSQAASLPQKSTPTSPDEDIVAIEQAILEAISDQRETVLAYVVNEVRVAETRISEDDKWAASYTVMIDPETGEVIPSEPGLVISLRTNTGWNVAIPTDQDWTALVESAPTDIVPESVKETYLGMEAFYAQAAPAAPIGGFLLPWEAGKTVYLSRSTAHDADIPSGNAHYGFDFYISKTMFDLYAARAGTVWRARWEVPNGDASDAGNFIVIQDTTTTPATYHLYLHLAQNSIPPELREKGTPVSQGQFIGIADDTGASTGHHLHFQVHTNPDSYWGRSVDITFNDVDINGGRPRRSVDAEYCDWPGDVCQVYRSDYVSGNTIHAGDTVPPIGDLFEPQTGLVLTTSTLHVEGWATDLESGLDYAQLIALYDNTWHEIGEQISSLTFGYDWNLCSQNVPDGPVSLALRIWDQNGNPANGLPGLRHFTKDFNCTPPPPACLPSASQAAIFSSIDFGGECALLGEGEYSEASSFGAVGDNNVQSIIVGTNILATLYDNEDLSGRAETFSSNDPSLEDNLIENNRTSSIKISDKNDQPNTPSELTAPDEESTFVEGSSISLAWQDAGGGREFQAQIITPSGDRNSPWLEHPIWKLDDLYLVQGTYLWRVRSRNCEDTSCRSAWSGYSTFTITPADPLPDPIDLPFTDDVEDGIGDWQATGLWNRLKKADRAHGGSYSWYYGDPSLLHYEDGTANTGDLTSPPINISDSDATLGFWYRYDTESHGKHFDQRWVQISVDGGAFQNEVQLSDDVMLYDDSSQIWLQKRVDLAKYAGKTIQIRFHFETLDPQRNADFEGWFIDDIGIAANPILDCRDSDNALEHATLIEFGQTKNKVICPSGDVDYFKFTANAGDRISADITTSTENRPDGLDLILFLIDGDGESVLATHDDEIYAVRLDPHLGYQITRSGTYYLKARLWAHPRYGDEDFSYRLKLVKDNNKPVGAFKDFASGSFIPGSEPFTLSLEAEDSLSGIAHVQFLFHTGDWQAGWQDLGSDWDGSDGWGIEFDPTALGEQNNLAFFAHVYDWAGNWSGIAAWDLAIDQSSPVSAMESLPSQQDSTAISLGWTSSDNLSGIDHIDLQSQANSGSWVDFSPDPSGNTSQMWFISQPGVKYGFRLRAVDRAGNTEAYPTSAETSTTVPSAATLCSLPDAWDTSTSTNDNSATKATVISVGSPAQRHNFCNPLSTDRANDEDWIRFIVEAGKVYSILAYPRVATSAANLELYAGNGTTLLASSSPLNLGNPTPLLWLADRSGSIYVRVRHIDGRILGNPITYDLIVAESGQIYLPVIHRK